MNPESLSAVHDIPVLIVGAGPTGLTAAALLGQQGLDCWVIDRRTTTATAPAAHVVNGRTFEVFRSAGVDMAALTAAAQPVADSDRSVWVHTLFDPRELGALSFGSQDREMSHLTPTPLRNLSQHRMEPILEAHVRQLDGVQIRRGHEWMDFTQDAQGVTSRLRDLATGEVTTVRSRWLLAADGASSAVRRSMGIEMEGPARVAAYLMVHFNAAWRQQVKPAVLYWTTAPDAGGTFVSHGLDTDWVYMQPIFGDAGDPAQYTAERCLELLRRATGDETLEVPIRNISLWYMTAQVAQQYRDHRVFLLGDAAHRFPPTGGLGLNTGVQDAHNLVWKLAAVDRGIAGDGLLDTYFIERQPVARRNADWSLVNAMKLVQVPQALASPDDAGKPARVAQAIAQQAEHFDSIGLELGFRYERGAVISDGKPPPPVGNPVREFVPNGCPGSRLPHAWIVSPQDGRSTLDLVRPGRFLLVAGAEGAPWLQAARDMNDAPLDVIQVGRDVPDAEGEWTTRLGITPGGALLVRPDQHVGWRSAVAMPSPGLAMRAALSVLLGKTE
jgi:2,4-dichlorophenol 6-monooxygenase